MSGRRHLRFEALAALVLLSSVDAWSAESAPAGTVSRRGSSWLTQVLVAELPKYVAKPAVETTEVSTSDEQAIERDGVLNLPTMTVRPVMKESPSDYGWLTPKGRMELALKRRPGLRLGNLFGLNGGIASFMLLEEQEVRAKAVLLNRVESASIDGSEDTKETRRLLQSALLRPNADWLYSSRGK